MEQPTSSPAHDSPGQQLPERSASPCCACLVAPACPTLCDPMDCSPPGSSAHGILQARIQESLLQRIFLTQGSNLSLLHCRRIPYQLSTRETQVHPCRLLHHLTSRIKCQRCQPAAALLRCGSLSPPQGTWTGTVLGASGEPVSRGEVPIPLVVQC